MNTPFPARWKVSDPVLIAETFSSRIWKVMRDDGSMAVVKDLKPFDDVEDELRGAHFLSWRDGVGAVRLLGLDGRRMLLEYAGDRLLLHELDESGDRAATAIAAEILGTLLSPSGSLPPADLQPLQVRFEALFRRAATGGDAAKTGLYVEAAALAERLLENPFVVRPLHGDLHHENIVHGPRGWLAIDPKGALGDPGFDAANFFYNPLGRDDLCRSQERIASMAESFANVLGQDVGAILDHAFAYGCLSASWHAAHSNSADEERELSIAEAIRGVRKLSSRP